MLNHNLRFFNILLYDDDVRFGAKRKVKTQLNSKSDLESLFIPAYPPFVNQF